MEAPDHCEGVGRPYIVGRQDSKKQAVLFQPRCGMWTCPYCAEQNRLYWSARAAVGIAALLDNGQPARFMTVTSAGAVTPSYSVIRFRVAWPRLRKMLQVRNGDTKLEYLLVPERQQSGRLHAHFATNVHVSSHALHNLAWRSGMGYQAKVEVVNSAVSAAWYTAKYIGKQMAGTSWPFRFRRVRTSQHWPELPERLPLLNFKFTVHSNSESAWFEIGALREAGYTVIDKLPES